MKYGRVNSLTNVIDNVIEADTNFILEKPDYDRWVEIDSDQGIGYIYQSDGFIKAPAARWPIGFIYDSNTNRYVPPIDPPDSGYHRWNEITLSWDSSV